MTSASDVSAELPGVLSRGNTAVACWHIPSPLLATIAESGDVSSSAAPLPSAFFTCNSPWPPPRSPSNQSAKLSFAGDLFQTTCAGSTFCAARCIAPEPWGVARLSNSHKIVEFCPNMGHVLQSRWPEKVSWNRPPGYWIDIQRWGSCRTAPSRGEAQHHHPEVPGSDVSESDSGQEAEVAL